MLIWNPSKLTTKGKALLAKAQAGRCTIKITKAQTGSGQYSSGEATDTRTSLKAPVQTLPIHSKEIQNGSTLVLKVAITNKTSDTDVLKSGYEIREFGILHRIRTTAKSYTASQPQAPATTCQHTMA